MLLLDSDACMPPVTKIHPTHTIGILATVVYCDACETAYLGEIEYMNC